MSVSNGNKPHFYIAGEQGSPIVDRVFLQTLGLLHRECKGAEEASLLVRRLKEAIATAVSSSLTTHALPDFKEEELERWRQALQAMYANLDNLQSADAQSQDLTTLARAEVAKVLEGRSKTDKDYVGAFNRAVADLEPTNAVRLKLALAEVALGFKDSGVERDEHFRIARHALHELLGDLEGELCAPGWALYGLIQVWCESDLGDTSKSLATALRRLRLSEGPLTALCLRARAYVERQLGNHEGALSDLMRGLEASADPDIPLEALASAIALQRNSIGGQLVEACLDRSPLWVVLILGDPAMAAAHGAALQVFERRAAFLRKEVEYEIGLALKLVQCIRECSRTCGVDLAPAIAKIQGIATLRQTAKTASAVELYALRLSVRLLREESEKLAKELLSAFASRKNNYLSKVAGKQKAILMMRASRVKQAREWLDAKTTAALQDRAKTAEVGFVSDRAATQSFAFSCFLFLSYLALGTYMALYGSSPAITRPFAYVGLVVACLPALIVTVRQGIYSVRGWNAESRVKHQIKDFQRQFETMITEISLRYEQDLAAADEEYREAKEDATRAANALDALTEGKTTKLKLSPEFKPKEAQPATESSENQAATTDQPTIAKKAGPPKKGGPAKQLALPAKLPKSKTGAARRAA